MDFEFPASVRRLQVELHDFMREQVLPANAEWLRIAEECTFPLTVVDDLGLGGRVQGGSGNRWRRQGMDVHEMFSALQADRRVSGRAGSGCRAEPWSRSRAPS